MPVLDVAKDLQNHILIITAEFAAPVERVWQLYANPRQLEQVWGPPSHPATFVDHDLTVGARVTYYMTGPEGEKYAGWWRILEVDAPHRLSFNDGFADDDFNPVEHLPVSRNEYTFETGGPGTRATYRTSYDSVEALEKALEMGMEEGARLALGQIDMFLARA